MMWQTARFALDLTAPKIMGIINLTPDSFSDGGTYSRSFQAALEHAEQLLNDGADILDIGGESTRPNADYVSPEQEWQRVRPILAELSRWDVPISLDTRRASVMRLALEKGWDGHHQRCAGFGRRWRGGSGGAVGGGRVLDAHERAA